jgi:hypothetical protein
MKNKCILLIYFHFFFYGIKKERKEKEMPMTSAGIYGMRKKSYALCII